MIEFALIGCGAIGSAIVEALEDKAIPNARLVGILDRNHNEVIKRAEHSLGCEYLNRINKLMELKPRIVIEAAGHEAVYAYGKKVIEAGIDFLPMSVGAFADKVFLQDIMELANKNGSSILLPSGAIGGLDVLRSSAIRGNLDEVVLTSTKQPRALANQPYIIKQEINLEAISNSTVVFDGPALSACLAFPLSSNIAASVSLAGIGFEQTQVRIIADPQIPRTIHKLQAHGPFGELLLTLQTRPHPNNYRTSLLACLSSVASCKNIETVIRFV
jgi:aspartate dehydrogenase